MHLRFTGKHSTPTKELSDRILVLSEGGEQCFSEASLRPSDEVWWTQTTRHIAEAILEDFNMRGESDATLAARIPQSVYQHCYGQSDKDRVTRDRIALMRRGGTWILPIGFLLQGTERIALEALHKGDKVIAARTRLQAFSWVIACEAGFARCIPTEYTEE